MAAPTVVQSVGKTTTSAGTSLQLTGLTTSAGNLFLVSIGLRTGAVGHVSSVTDSASNTWARQSPTSAGAVVASSEIWTTINDSPSAITSVTVNLDSSLAVAFRFVEINGGNNPVPNIGVAGSAASTASITTTAAPATWPAASLVIASSASAQNTADYTAAQAFTAGTPTVLPSTTTGDASLVSGSEIDVQTAYLALNTTSAQTYTETLSGAHAWSACLVVIPGKAKPRVVQSVASTNTAAQTSRTLSGLTTTAGNLYGVLVGASNNTSAVTSVTDSASNSWAKQVQVAEATNAEIEFWTTTASSPSAITSVTVNIASCRFAFRFFEFADANNTTPVDASSTGTGNSSSLNTGASGTPAGSGDLALGAGDAQLGNLPEFNSPAFTSASPPASMVLPSTSGADLSDGGGGAQADLQSAYILGSSGAQTFTGTLTGSTHWAGLVVLIQAAAVAVAAVQPPPARGLRPGRGPYTFKSVQAAPAPFGVAVSNAYSQVLSGVLSFTGAGPVRAVSKSLPAASLSFTGSGPVRAIVKGLGSPSLSFSGALRRAVSTGLVGATLSFSGALARFTAKAALTAALSFGGAISRQLGRPLSGVLSFTGGGPQRSIGKGLSGSLSFTGAGPLRAIVKGLGSAALSFSGLLTKFTTKTPFTGTLSFSGAIQSGKQFLRTLTGTLSFAGAIAKLPNKSLGGTLSFSGNGPLRAIRTGLTGGLSFGGSLSRSIRTGLSAAALSFAGGLASGKQYVRSLTGALSFSGSTSKQTQRPLGGGLSFSGSIPSRAIGKSLGGGLSFIGGGPGRAIGKAIGSVLSFLGGFLASGNVVVTGPGATWIYLASAYPVSVFATNLNGSAVAFFSGKAVRFSNWAGTTTSPTGGYRNVSGTLYDPTTPSLKYRLPGAAEVTVSGVSLTKDGVGLYSYIITPSQDGDAVATFTSNDGAYADPISFKIEPAPL